MPPAVISDSLTIAGLASKVGPRWQGVARNNLYISIVYINPCANVVGVGSAGVDQMARACRQPS